MFYHAELLRLLDAEAVVSFYHSRAASPNWAEWAKANALPAAILNNIEQYLKSQNAE